MCQDGIGTVPDYTCVNLTLLWIYMYRGILVLFLILIYSFACSLVRSVDLECYALLIMVRSSLLKVMNNKHRASDERHYMPPSSQCYQTTC